MDIPSKQPDIMDILSKPPDVLSGVLKQAKTPAGLGPAGAW